MGKIINLTQHTASREQRRDGVFDVRMGLRSKLHELLTFETIPDRKELVNRAAEVAVLARREFPGGEDRIAMIGGAPYFMAPLTEALIEEGFEVRFAFSERRSREEVDEHGVVHKAGSFKHLGWVYPAR